MRIKYLLPVLLFTITVHAQQVHFQGRVIDSQNNSPIAVATISIESKSLFYPADNEGKFDITSDKIIQTDSVSFSCIGYQTQKIKAGDIKTNSIIKLTPLIHKLAEIKIGANSLQVSTVGSSAKINHGSGAIRPGYEIAMYMTGSNNIKGIIQTVGYYLCNGKSVAKGGDATAPFRIKIYGVDTSGAPGEELTKDVIIVSAKKSNAWFDVDISNYNISVPNNGFFVSFCLLDSAYYEMRKGYHGAHLHIYTFASPRLARPKDEPKECRSYIGENGYFGWEWDKDPYNLNYMIRATIMPPE